MKAKTRNKEFIIAKGKKYVFFLPNENNSYSKYFLSKLGEQVNPPIVKNGGISESRIKIITPKNDVFYGFSYKGDIEGWNRQIELSTIKLNMMYAKINHDELLLSDGTVFLLNDCIITDYENNNMDIIFAE